MGTSRNSVKNVTKRTTTKTTTTKKKKEPSKKEKLMREIADAFTKMRTKIPKEGATREKIDSILKSPRNKNINLVGRAFRVGPQGSSEIYTGLTHKLHDKFWPDTCEDPRDPSCQKRKKLRRPANARPSGMKSKCKNNGAKHGTAVHRQVFRITKGIAEGKPIKGLLRGLDPCTVRIMLFFIQKNWIPIASELMMYSEIWKTATAQDIFVLDLTEQKVVAIETKTGFEDEEYFIHPTDGNLRTPLATVKNCPYHRHSLQLLCNLLMLKTGYDFKVDDAYILRTCPKAASVLLYKLPVWAHNKQIQSDIHATMSKR